MPDRVVLTLDIDRMTLGEMMDVELASGKAFTALLQSKTGRVMIALYLRASQQRAPGTPAPTWQQLAAMTQSEALQYVSPESADSDLKMSDN